MNTMARRAAAVGMSAALALGASGAAFADGAVSAPPSSPAPQQAALEEGIPVDAWHFPDEAFRAFILSQPYGNDGVLSREEIESVTGMRCIYKGVRDLTGIEYFTNLISLDVEGNRLTQVDISALTKLKVAYLRNNELASIDFSGNTALEFIEIFDNRLTEIDVSMCKNLRFLHIDHNDLRVLDMSANTKLENGGFIVKNNPHLERIVLPDIEGSEGLVPSTAFVNAPNDETPTYGYTGIAWYADEGHTVPIDPDEVIPFDGRTIYGDPIPNAYTLSFEAGSPAAHGAMASIEAKWDIPVVMPECAFSRTGYSFAGWKVVQYPETPPASGQAEGEEKTVQAGEGVSRLAGRSSNDDAAIATALWRANEYTVLLSAGSSSGASHGIRAVYGEAFTLPTPEDVGIDAPRGMVFAGWMLPSGEVVDAKATLSNLTDADGATVELVAQWAVDELAALKVQLLDEVDDALSACGPRLYEGAFAQAIQSAVDARSAIDAASDEASARAAADAFSAVLAALPEKGETDAAAEAAFFADEPAGTLPGDIAAVHEGNLDDARAVCLQWETSALEGRIRAFVERSHPSPFTDADREAIAAAVLASPRVGEQREACGSLARAVEVVERHPGLSTKAAGDVRSSEAGAYREACEAVEQSGLADTLLADYGHALGIRGELADAKASDVASARAHRESAVQESVYTDEELARLDEALAAAIASIEGAETAQEAHAALAEGMARMDGIPATGETAPTPPNPDTDSDSDADFDTGSDADAAPPVSTAEKDGKASMQNRGALASTADNAATVAFVSSFGALACLVASAIAFIRRKEGGVR